MITREEFEANKPNLRDYRLTAGYAEGHDAFDDSLAKIREGGAAAFTPRAAILGE